MSRKGKQVSKIRITRTTTPRRSLEESLGSECPSLFIGGVYLSPGTRLAGGGGGEVRSDS